MPETIKALREAGINIWLLTGDKTETAINVAHSCGLIDKDYRVITIDAISRADVLFQIIQGKCSIEGQLHSK